MKQNASLELFDFDFAQIVGPKSSAAANFEELVSELLAREVGAEAIDGSGGDLGIDCYVGRFRGRLTAFQAKYFLGRLRKSQRAQVKKSFETANNYHQVTTWILCIPLNPNPDEREWLDSLGDQTEWWGETKLRSLLAKYPDVGRKFFRETVISARLASVEGELSRLRDELLPRLDRHHSAEQVERYIATASNDCRAASDDLLSLHGVQDIPWVTIDFSELYAYLSADPSLVVRRPLIDFCLGHSPWPIILPPGTVYEVGTFVQRSPFRWEAEDFLQRLRRTPEARAFVQEFGADPTTSQAETAYRRFVARMRYSGVQDNLEVSRLANSLQSTSISAAPTEYRCLPRDQFARALQYFNMLRPMKPRPNSADAANMVFLLMSEDHLKVPSRMISSALSMATASRELCSGRALVRTPRQFTLFLTAGRTREEGQRRLLKALDEIRGLTRVLAEPSASGKQPLTKREELLPALRGFASAYRELLRPVDEMIEDGFRAVSRSPVTREYYEVLRDDALQVATFGRFWNRVAADYRAIDTILRERHGYDEIADQLEPGDN